MHIQFLGAAETVTGSKYCVLSADLQKTHGKVWFCYGIDLYKSTQKREEPKSLEP